MLICVYDDHFYGLLQVSKLCIGLPHRNCTLRLRGDEHWSSNLFHVKAWGPLYPCLQAIAERLGANLILEIRPKEQEFQIIHRDPIGQQSSLHRKGSVSQHLRAVPAGTAKTYVADFT